MTVIHLETPERDWRRDSRRPRHAGGFVERTLAAVREWRRRRRIRSQITALNPRISRDIEICRGDPIDLDREQKERDAWLDTLNLPPF